MNNSSNLIKYVGESYPDLGVENGMSLDDVFKSLANTLQEIKKERVVLIPGSEPVDISVAVKSLLERKISTDDILVSSKDFFEKSSVVSEEASKLSQLEIPLTFYLQGGVLLATFDYSKIETAGFSIFSAKSKVYTYDSFLLQESNAKTGSLSLKFEDVPILLDIEIRVSTGGRIIEMTSLFNVGGSERGERNLIFNVKDYMSFKNTSNSSVTDALSFLKQKTNEVSIIQKSLESLSVSDLKSFEKQKGVYELIQSACSLCQQVTDKVLSLEQLKVDGLSGRGIESCIRGIASTLETQQTNISTCLRQLSGITTTKFIESNGFVPDGACVGCSDTPGTFAQLLPTPLPIYNITNISSFILKGKRVVLFTVNEDSFLINMLSLIHGEYSSEWAIGKVDVLRNPQWSYDLAVNTMPTIVFYNDNVETSRITENITENAIKEKMV